MKQNEQQRKEEKMTTEASEGETKIYLTSDSTLQSQKEWEQDKNADPRQDNSLSVSNDDLREGAGDRFAGSDRAGTAERKDNDLNTENDQD